MSVKFGTSGLRGLASDLLAGPAELYTQSFVEWLRSRGDAVDKVFVGRDLRESSEAMAAACMSALARSRVSPIDCGVLPTPALALYAAEHKSSAIMITGSHIPEDRNGLKFYGPHGEINKRDEIQISKTASRLETQGSPYPGGAIGVPFNNCEYPCTDIYIRRYLSLYPDIELSGMRVGIYQHSSVSRDLLVDVLNGLGAETVLLGRTSHFVALDTEAISPEVARLMENWTRTHKLDAIVSTDPDGDRPLIADENGLQIRGDVIGLIAAKFLRTRWVVTPITSNSGIDGELGFKSIRTRVGSPYVIEGVYEALSRGDESVAGFEANGGFILGNSTLIGSKCLTPLVTRDALLPIVLVLGQVAKSKVSIEKFISQLKIPVCLSAKIDCPSSKSARILSAIEARREAAKSFLGEIGEPKELDTTDGPRILLNNGEVVHLRASGNAPELRVYVEAETNERAAKLLQDSMQKVRELLG